MNTDDNGDDNDRSGFCFVGGDTENDIISNENPIVNAAPVHAIPISNDENKPLKKRRDPKRRTASNDDNDDEEMEKEKEKEKAIDDDHNANDDLQQLKNEIGGSPNGNEENRPIDLSKQAKDDKPSTPILSPRREDQKSASLEALVNEDKANEKPIEFPPPSATKNKPAAP